MATKQKNIKKETKSKKTKKKSLTEKFNEISNLVANMDYMDEVPNISDDEVNKSVYPDVRIPIGSSGKALRVVCDSTTDTIRFSECEYNGPNPIGYREMPVARLPLKGVFGKFMKHFAARNFYLGDQLNAWFMQNCFIYKACSMPGDDAVSCGYELNTVGKKDKGLIEHLKDKFNSEDFNLDETMRKMECYKRGFGGVVLIPCFEEDVDMEDPLVDYSQLRGKTFLGWSVIEPYYLSPEIASGSRELLDPSYKFYMQPTHWNLYGGVGSEGEHKRIHRSWCFFRRNMFTSTVYLPMYKYFGPSVPQAIIERLYSAEVCANESSMLLRSKRSFVIETDVRKMAANPAYAEKFLRNCQGNSDNWGVRVVPRNSNARQMDTYLNECMQLTTAQYGILCAEVDIPAPKFMMAQLTGFANSGNYEIKLYSANVKKIQEQNLRQLIQRTARIEAACLGKDARFDVEFGEIDLPTVIEQANIMYEKARATKFTAEASAIKNGYAPINNHKATTEKMSEKSYST